jgi:hypothetical protein
MAKSNNRPTLESLFNGRKKAVRTPPTNIGPLKKRGMFDRLKQLKAQMDALIRRIEMMQALPSPTPCHIAPGTPPDEDLNRNIGVKSIADSNSVT